MTPEPGRYWGFISYSHRDRRWGEWLHRAIESYRVPKRLVGSTGAHGPVPARLFPIFRDRAELSTAAGLSEALTQAIEGSRFFIVVCSPQAAASRWVNDEIRHVKRLGRADRILCLIVDGEPYASDGAHPERECFPPALRFDAGPEGELPTRAPEPLAADVRADGDGRDDARLKLIAGLLGVGFDALRRRDLQARNRRLGLIAAGAVLVSIAMAAMTLRAVVAEHAADNSRQRGEDLIGFMLGDLRGKLEPLGKLDILDAVGDQAMGYFEKLDSHNLSEAALVARAKALRQIGDVRFQQGRAADAAQAFDAALTLSERLAKRHPNDADLQFELGQAEFWAGYTAWRAGQNDRAEPHLQSYRDIALRGLAREPGSTRWQLERAYAESNLGSLDNSRHRYPEALEHFRACASQLLTIKPETDAVLETRVDCMSWQGSTLQAMGRANESLDALAQQVQLARALVAARAGDQQRRRQFGYALAAQAGGALSADQAELARRACAEGIPIADALITLDPGSAENKTLSVHLRLRAALAEAVLGDLAAAERRLSEAMTTLHALLEQDPGQLDLQDERSLGAALGYDLAMARQHIDLAQRAIEAVEALCAAVDSPLAQADPARCLEHRLHAWELATLRGADAAPAAAAFDRAIDGIADGGNRVAIDDLRIRALVLSGRRAEALTRLDALSTSGYLSASLRLFLQRHHVALRSSGKRSNN